jgi:hypothetical protein
MQNSNLLSLSLQPLIFCPVTALLAGLSLAASYAPARGALRVDP